MLFSYLCFIYIVQVAFIELFGCLFHELTCMNFNGWYQPNLWCPWWIDFLCFQIDGFEQDKKVVVIAATNRKQDLDPALIRYISEKLMLIISPESIGEFSNKFYVCSQSVWFNDYLWPTWSAESTGNSCPVCEAPNRIWVGGIC
jgi:hypothetical protein